MKIHFDQVGNLAGFATENAAKGDIVKILTRTAIISDESDFYKYIDQISSIFLDRAKVYRNSVYQLLVLIHNDLSADLYVNDFPYELEMMSKKDVKKGEAVGLDDIADIRRLKFNTITVTPTAKVICCFKVGWKFGLFFDLDRTNDLDIDGMHLTLGSMYRYLTFQHVYEVVESVEQFNEMLEDGWFPFIEIIGSDFKKLSDAYTNKSNIIHAEQDLIGKFVQKRIEKIVERWWKKSVFNSKKPIIEAGISAYLTNTTSGYINSIKTLLNEAEGILRIKYFTDKSKGNNVKVAELLEYLIEKGRSRSGSDYSLFMITPFIDYLNRIVFANFNLETGKLDYSRNSTSHGVAKPEDYTKARALQSILILDQIYFYID
jgi:hypothetical protein